MKAYVTLYRVAPFNTSALLCNIKGADIRSPDFLQRVQERFGTLPPRFKIYAQDNRKAFGCMEVMSFDIKAEAIPFSAMMLADPIDEREVDRVDGALRGEMERLGIDQSRIQDYHWRMELNVKGN
jgi:hypothetical protein